MSAHTSPLPGQGNARRIVPRSPVVSGGPSLLPSIARLAEIAEIAEWLQWIREEISSSGLELPSEETSVLFATEGVRMAARLKQVCGHLPGSIRTSLIEPAILHQCWSTQRERNRAGRVRQLSRMESTRGQSLVGRTSGEIIFTATDGYSYLVKFPRSDTDSVLATEAICIELARLMGLPVPPAKVVEIDAALARDAGIQDMGWPRYISKSGSFTCLGLRVPPSAISSSESRMGRESCRALDGILVFDLLVLNAIHDVQFEKSRGRVQPVFLYHSRAMMDANWQRFLKAGSREWINLSAILTERIVERQQLEFWIARAMNVDLNQLWRLVFALPSVWYGERRSLAANVLKKLEKRIGDLRVSLDFQIQQGSFANFKEAAEPRPAVETR